jgi:hypothetical protein
MLRLDCSSPTSTCASLSEIFGVAPEEVEHRCSTLDLEPYVEDPRRSFIAPLFDSTPPAQLVHATRAFPSRIGFAEGLLPLGLALEGIWADLYALVRDECPPSEWAGFRTWVETDHPINLPAGYVNAAQGKAAHLVRLYRMKAGAKYQWGPFGFLVREVALRAPTPHRNYWANAPEIVEDICAAYEDRFGRDLEAIYLSATQPCLVKFYQLRDCGGILDIAAHYLCTSAQGIEIHWDLNTNFDGRGQAVPPERIIEVQVNPLP